MQRYQYMEYCTYIELASLCTVLTIYTATGGVSPRTRPPSRSRVGSTHSSVKELFTPGQEAAGARPSRAQVRNLFSLPPKKRLAFRMDLPVQTTGRGNVHKDDDFSIKKDSSWCGIRKRLTCTCLICFFGLRLALCTKQFF